MNPEEFKQWLKDRNYCFWYEEQDNEIWVNTQFTIIWHPAYGLRYQIANDEATEEYLLSLVTK